MENEEKYLKKLKRQNEVLIIILIISVWISIYPMIYNHIDKIQYNMYKNSGYYYEYNVGATQNIEAFNSQFTVYGGIQTGAKLKSMCNKIIENANTYRNDGSKIVKIDYSVDGNVIKDNRLKETKSKFFDNTIYGCYKDRVEYGRKNKEIEKNDKVFEEYINTVIKTKDSLINKHSYSVSFKYRADGLLDTIIIQEYVRD